MLPSSLCRPLLIFCLLVPIATFAEPLDTPEDWVAIHKEPSEKECRTYIERALKEQRSHSDSPLKDVESTINEDQSAESEDNSLKDEILISETKAPISSDDAPDSIEDSSPVETLQSPEDSVFESSNHLSESAETEVTKLEENNLEEKTEDKSNESEITLEIEITPTEDQSEESASKEVEDEKTDNAIEKTTDDDNDTKEADSEEQKDSGEMEQTEESGETKESSEDTADSTETVKEGETSTVTASGEDTQESTETTPSSEKVTEEELEANVSHEGVGEDVSDEDTGSNEESNEMNKTLTKEADSKETEEKEESAEVEVLSQEVEKTEDSGEESGAISTEEKEETISKDQQKEVAEKDIQSVEDTTSQEVDSQEKAVIEGQEGHTAAEELLDKSSEAGPDTSGEVQTGDTHPDGSQLESDKAATSEESSSDDAGEALVAEQVTPEEEDLIMKREIPENLRQKIHIGEILKLDGLSQELVTNMAKIEDITLRELKRVYETAIKPLEILYKYRDLSNRHFGDAEIFSKPLILFMGPWSGGKSTIINYLLDNEFKNTALRTGAEPSPAYFNIVMAGDSEEILDGTQLAADWTFSGLQKFGQGLLDRLRGLKMNHPLLEKVNIVEIPGILEIRKQVERLFPFNDACQWFIDRADIIFLVYDPSKLDVGPETEAILDQLKGREYQTRIILNKADQVKPEELMRVQGTLIWNISPLMSSTEPPVMYSTSLWSLPYESGSPTRLLFAQEKAFLRDLREAVEKRVENKIASARRFAVRVRNHAKMVDCYLTTYYNHKSFFGNKQKVAEDIIENPQNYHIYEGLSTLTNISRYDLPDPDVYRDFFRLNPVYDFQQLASTCTYFKGCPINRLDVAIAYDLPELLGKFKKQYTELVQKFSGAPPSKK